MGQSYVYLNTDAGELCKLFVQALEKMDGTQDIRGSNAFKPGDGHITLLYGANPHELDEILEAVREELYVNECHESWRIRITGVEISHDGKSIICMLDSPLLNELFQDLYGNPIFCCGHPEYTGFRKFEDEIYMKRRPHFTLVIPRDESFERIPRGLSEFVTNFSVSVTSLGLKNGETNEIITKKIYSAGI